MADLPVQLIANPSRVVLEPFDASQFTDSIVVPLRSNLETLLFKQLREQFPAAVISYDPRLYVYHVVRKEKMSFIGSAHRAFLIGRATFHILQKPVLGSWWSRFRRFLYLTREFTADMIRGALQRDRQQYPFLRNYLYECGLQRIVQLGINYEVLRQRKP